MSESELNFASLLSRARKGDRKALDQLLTMQRPSLRTVAQQQMDPRIGARIDASDIVQQTLLSVSEGFQEFQGSDEAEFAAWVNKIHERNVQQMARLHVRTQKRAVTREKRLTDSDATGENYAYETRTTPSQHLIKAEQAIEVERVLQGLPPDQMTVIRLRFVDGLSLAEIANSMGRSEEAAAGLLKRSLIALRKRMAK